jgi:hypothetical protein
MSPFMTARIALLLLRQKTFTPEQRRSIAGIGGSAPLGVSAYYRRVEKEKKDN